MSELINMEVNTINYPLI